MGKKAKKGKAAKPDIESEVKLMVQDKKAGGKKNIRASVEEIFAILGADAVVSHGITGGEKFNQPSPEELEMRRSKVQRLIMRGIHKQDIADALGIHLKTVYSDINAMKKQIRQNVMQMDLPLFVGETLEFYDEIKQIALRMASGHEFKDPKVRLQALREAVNAEDSKHRFLSLAGLYKAVTPSKAYASLQQDDDVSMQDVLSSISAKLSTLSPAEAAEAFEAIESESVPALEVDQDA